MSARTWIIGTQPNCDIRVKDSVVSGEHCRLTERGESFLLEDLRSLNGTYVAGERITTPRIVRRGDPVTLGRNLPLPWPAQVDVITIGRDRENDIVIPVDAVSGEHAQLEREGNRVFLVDRDSTNGTAINDPLNKITRAPLTPSDSVFLGTHRIAASFLLSSLPPIVVRDTTMPERARLAELEKPAESVEPSSAPLPTAATVVAHPFGAKSPIAWFWGIALSLLSVAVIFGGARSCRQEGSVAVHDPALSDHSDAAPPALRRVHDKEPVKKVVPPSELPSPDEKLVRKSQDAVAMIALRVDAEVAMFNVTAWACRGNAVICPTAALQALEDDRKDHNQQDESIVVCTPTDTVAILDHKPGTGPAASFSIATLEIPHATICDVALGPEAVSCIPGQKLAILSTSSVNHDPKSITRDFTIVSVDRIDRGADHAPTMYKCRYDGATVDVLGSPVFDSSGLVVGCVHAIAQQAHEVHIVPIAQLASLLEPHP